MAGLRADPKIRGGDVMTKVLYNLGHRPQLTGAAIRRGSLAANLLPNQPVWPVLKQQQFGPVQLHCHSRALEKLYRLLFKIFYIVSN